MENVNIVATVGMPLYNMGVIAELALEGLANQKTQYKWELIVCEENTEEKLGNEVLQSYKERLEEAGCISIKYIELPEWVPLGQKWKIIADAADDTLCFILQAGDCYAHSKRIESTCSAFLSSKIDYYDEERGYFYSFRLNKTILFNRKRKNEHPCRLNMAWLTSLIKMLPESKQKMNVDNYLFNTLQAKQRRVLKRNIVKYRNNELYADGVDTDGYNKISSRDRYFKIKHDDDFFQHTDFDALAEIPILQKFQNKKLTRKRFKD
jgi:hypothetical protein